MIAVFAQIDSLPCPEVEAARRDWNLNAGAKKAAFQVGWHVIAAFVGVTIVRLVFRHRMVEEAFKIGPHGRVCVFIDGQLS